MSAKILFIPIHSLADVITNSSSELFICNTEKTKEQIEEMLGLLAEAIGECHGAEVEVYEGVAGLREIIERLGSYIEYYGIENLIRHFVGYQVVGTMQMPSLKRTWDISIDRLPTPEERKAARNSIEASNKAEMQRFWDTYTPLLEKHVKSFAVIRSEEDNSIPYDLFDIINNRLNGVNYHLG